jgi:hypothetical protein
MLAKMSKSFNLIFIVTKPARINRDVFKFLKILKISKSFKINGMKFGFRLKKNFFSRLLLFCWNEKISINRKKSILS